METIMIEFFNSQLNGDFILIAIVLYGVGIGIRSSKKISSDLIPTILMILGGLLNLIFMISNTPKENFPNTLVMWVIFLITATAKGIFSALCSSGIFSCLKNYGITIGKRGYNKQDEDIDIKTKSNAELQSITENTVDNSESKIDDNTSSNKKINDILNENLDEYYDRIDKDMSMNRKY